MNSSDFELLSSRAQTPRTAVGRGRTLPSSRAAIGALLVVLSGLGLTYATRQATAEPTTRFAVATRELAPGELVGAGDVRLQTMRLSPDVASRAFSDANVLIGTVTVGPVGRGELIQSSLVQRGGPSLREMSFPIPAARALNGNVDPGDRIDIVATTGSGTDAVTRTVLTGLQVLEVNGNDLDPADDSTIVLTVAITDPHHQDVLAEAANRADLFVVKANDHRMIDRQDESAVEPQATGSQASGSQADSQTGTQGGAQAVEDAS